MWDHIQRRLAMLLNKSDQVMLLNSDEIKLMLYRFNTFIEIGEDYTSEPATQLRDAIKTRCQEYFERFHTDSWNKISFQLKSEQWNRLRIPSDFSISGMVGKILSYSGHILKSLTTQYEEFSSKFSSLALGNPFEKEDNSIFTEPNGFSIPKSETSELPVLCVTAEQVIKIICNYLQLMRSFTPISFQILINITQLVDYYVSFIQIFFIYSHFTPDTCKEMIVTDYSSDLNGEELEQSYDIFLFQSKFHTEKYKNLIHSVVRIRDFLHNSSYKYTDSIYPLPVADKKATSSFDSVSDSVIALESVKHVIEVVTLAEDYIKEIVPDMTLYYDFKDKSLKFMADLADFLDEVRLPKALSVTIIQIDWLNNSVNTAKWDEKSDEPHNFVDRLRDSLIDLQKRLESTGGGKLSGYSQSRLLKKSLQVMVEHLIDAFSKVKKCNSLGKQQMKIDLRGLESISSSLFGEQLNLSAYYEYLEIWKRSPDEIESWILSHIELPLKIHRALLLTAPEVNSMSKSNRAALQSRIEEKYKEVMSYEKGTLVSNSVY